MNHTDYPALYKAADSASIGAQSAYLRVVKFHIFTLIIGAALAINPLPTKEYSLFNAFVFLCALALSILLAAKKYERDWYSARAVAESVKTTAWRYMMKAEPFQDTPALKEVNSKFRNVLNEILKTNNQIGDLLGGNVSCDEQITEQMTSIRDSDLESRKLFYLEHRIDEQRKWYALKSSENKKNGKRIFSLLIFLQILAIICVLLRIAYPEWTIWPTDIFAVAASGALSWMQLKRYQEVAAAYALTAHEIGIIKGKLEESETDKEFSNFIKDSENAFSREHTQWAAKHEI